MIGNTQWTKGLSTQATYLDLSQNLLTLPLNRHCELCEIVKSWVFEINIFIFSISFCYQIKASSQNSAQLVGQVNRDGHGNRLIPGISQPGAHLFPLTILDLVIRAGELEDFVLCIRISSEAVDSFIAR